ncbi:MAG TPA: oligosaccharide flippase family protein, partial [Gemmatimonadaceae bacterium]
MLAQLRWNLVLLYAAEILGKVLGLVVFGYLARVLLTARYGDLEFALGVLFLLNLVIDAGLGHYGAREAAKHPEDTDRLVGQVALVRGLLVLVSLALLVSVALALPRDGLARSLIILQGLVLLPAPFILTWVFQARDQMHVVAAAAVIRQVLLAIGVLLVVRSPADVWLVPVWDAAGLGAAVALQVVLYRRSGGLINPFRWLSGLRRVVIESAPLAGSSVVWAVRLFSPLLALGVFRTASDVGVFGAGHRLVIALHTFVWLYFFNLLPSLSRLGTERGLERFGDLFTTSMRLVGWVAICGASLGSVLAPVLIPAVYGDGLVT